MRTIKFRTWEPMFGMHEPWELKDKTTFKAQRDVSGSKTFEIEWMEGTVFMQYTGLKDKNGVEIYEGDIINVEECELVDYEETDYGTVEKYEDSKGKVHYIGASFCFDGHSAGDLPLETFDINRIEVIGNIYANPNKGA